MSEASLIKRGFCCGNGCKNCPYYPKNTKGTMHVNAKALAKEIADDHYYILNQTYGARWSDAKNSAVISVERIIEALQDVCETDKQRETVESWREVLLEARNL